MTRSHELDHDRDHDVARRNAEATRAPGRGTRAQDLAGPTGPLPSGILMRKHDGNGVEPGAAEAVSRATSSSGRALPDHLRSKFEQSLGADLSGVRVHDGSASAASARAVGAKAYAHGNDIHFGAGHYDPTSAAGEHLLAHEVAHTVQQRGGLGRAQFKLEVSSPGDAHEVEADRAADAMVAGSRASVGGAGVHVAREIEMGNEGGVSASRDGIKVSMKPVVKKTFPTKWVDFELGYEWPIEASLERKEAEGDKAEGSAEGGKERPLGSYEGEATQHGTEALKHEIESLIGADKDSLEAEPPELEHNSEHATGEGFTVKVKFRGQEVSLKVTLAELKKGKLEGPSAAVELPIKLAEKTLWENADARLVVSSEIVATGKATPRWEEIGEWVMKNYGDKLVDLAERGAMTALEAMGSVAGLTAAGVMLVGTMVFAGVMDAIETNEVNAAIAGGKKEIDLATAAAMDAYGVRATPGNTSGFAVAAYTAAWNQVAEAFAKASKDDKFKEFNFSLDDPKLRAEVAKSLAPNTATLEARARRAAINNVARGVAQAYYDAHAGGDMRTDGHVSMEAQLICATLDPQNGSSWSPKPAVAHLDHGVNQVSNYYDDLAKKAQAQVDQAKANQVAREDQAIRDQQDAQAGNCDQYRVADPKGQSIDPSQPQQSQAEDPVWGQSKVE